MLKDCDQMRKSEKAKEAVERLERLYPEAVCSLSAETPFQLLVATRLSAQCTDARVNLVTPELFRRFPTPQAMASAPIAEIEECIRSCGLYKTKARDLKAMSNELCERHGGEVPPSLDDLTRLSGVGRKTANLIMGDVFGEPAVVADTHLIRISGRLGLCDSKDPYKVEMQLKKLLPKDKSNDFCHRIVHFGRDRCTARNPQCEVCELSDICTECRG